MRPAPLAHLFKRTLPLALALGAGSAGALSDAELAERVAARLQGDRTGACMAVALIERNTATAYVCANPNDRGRIDASTAFEIGAVSKTFMAALLAEQVLAKKMRLDDSASKYLPDGARMPGVGGEPITLRHLATHTSGLPAMPARMQVRDTQNPFASATAQQVIDSLPDVVLERPPGTDWLYSNFGGMLLSSLLSRHLGQDVASAAGPHLLMPLGMRSTFVGSPPPGVRLAQGHASNGRSVPHWDFPADLAGVGGFRSTLPDMARYVQAHLGRNPSPVDAMLALTRAPATSTADKQMGLAWIIAPLLERRVHTHEGHTGGFSSLVAMDTGSGRGVVVLSDTAFVSLGGLAGVGLPLLDDRLPQLGPRKPALPDAELIDALVGRFRLDSGAQISLDRQGSTLEMRSPGQLPALLGYDSTGDFYSLGADALLRPVPRPEGVSFIWLQGGSALTATRQGAAPRRNDRPGDAQNLADYAGLYRLAPGLELHVYAEDDHLMAQVGRQKPATLERALRDIYVAPQTGVELRFARENGKVVGLTARQGGNDLYGPRR